MIDTAQAWFWSPEWQEAEREVDADLESGRAETYENTEAFLAAVKARQKPANL
jgi:hypothetical protein